MSSAFFSTSKYGAYFCLKLRFTYASKLCQSFEKTEVMRLMVSPLMEEHVHLLDPLQES